MAQLTKEHFDKFVKAIDGWFESADRRFDSVEGQAESIGSQFKSMDHRFDSVEAKLGEQTRQLKAHTDTQIEILREEMQEGFAGMDQKLDALRELLDVRQRVEHLEEQMRQLQVQK